MKCPRCNAQLADNAGFCGICGYALSAPQGGGANAGPAFDKSRSGNNEATILAAPWANGQQIGSPPRAVPPSAPSADPGPFAANQNDPWSARPQAGWMADLAYQPDPGVAPAAMSRSGTVQPPRGRKKRRAGRIWASILLTLVLLLAILTGVWFFAARPYLHNIVVTQLNQALATPESQVELALLLPGSPRTFQVQESLVNQYLAEHTTDPVQNLHITITPESVNLSFTAYGQNCSVSALPIAVNGQLQVTNVQVQGVLGLIMSNDELTSTLNSNFQTFSAQLSHKITKITLQNQEIAIQLD